MWLPLSIIRLPECGPNITAGGTCGYH